MNFYILSFSWVNYYCQLLHSQGISGREDELLSELLSMTCRILSNSLGVYINNLVNNPKFITCHKMSQAIQCAMGKLILSIARYSTVSWTTSVRKKKKKTAPWLSPKFGNDMLYWFAFAHSKLQQWHFRVFLCQSNDSTEDSETVGWV